MPSLYELHHHFPKVAEESGFAFNVHRPRSHVDWNSIRLIDIDNVIRERRFSIIEQHISDIVNCVLESEFDVRILDKGVLTMFRLAQLAVEYQQFCRHYLDRSVFVLREELTSMAQELDTTKQNLKERDEEIRKLKRKTKHTAYRTPLPYGNDNIATMILNTLTKKTDIFPSTSNGDTLQYNKCSYCDKVFLNQLYLKSHMSRRHTNVTEIPQKDIPDTVANKNTEKENSHLNNEITELKAKLKEMETVIAKVQKQEQPEIDITKENNSQEPEIKTKDAEVSTNNEDYLLDKIEKWKREEHEKYNKEISLLRTQIIETINSLKQNDVKSAETKTLSESTVIEQLHSTIKHQGDEILVLKRELNDSKIRSEDEENERKKEVDAQMSLWIKRNEVQSKQYDVLLQKLNEVAREANEARALAESERKRAAKLQVLLEQNLSKEGGLNHVEELNKARRQNDEAKCDKSVQSSENLSTKTLSDRKALEKLHRKAQELLNIASSSSSDDSNGTFDDPRPEKNKIVKKTTVDKAEQNDSRRKEESKPNHKVKQNFVSKEKEANHLIKDIPHTEVVKTKPKTRKEKSKSHSNVAVNTFRVSGSPVRLVRAKITEEVNNRLVSAGVDPLKKRLAQNVYRKQRMNLEQNSEIKSKKNPAYQKVKHSILSYLDSNTTNMKTKNNGHEEYTSPSKLTKPFSLTSVISNVKNKALSLVKQNENLNIRNKRKTLNAEVAKRALSILKTPPGSTHGSPSVTGRNTARSIDLGDLEQENTPHLNNRETKPKKMKPARIIQDDETDSDEKSNKSDHKYYNSAIMQNAANSVESLMKSPARRPSSASANYTGTIKKYTIADDNMLRAQSETNLSEFKSDAIIRQISPESPLQYTKSSDEEESNDVPIKKSPDDNVTRTPKQTKGVLKHASSISSLNKKKVLFDMEAIQMKSVSASPSQSITDKSDKKEEFELGLLNLDGEEWDISSIENEPLKNDTRIQINTRTSPKIAELKQTIESQLARRAETPSTAIVGGVDILSGPALVRKAGSLAGSNTSLGSSILDESDTVPPALNHKAFVKPRITEPYNSDLDISEYSIDGLTKKTEESF